MTAPLLCTALGIEARAVRSGWPGAKVAVVGMRGNRLYTVPAVSTVSTVSTASSAGARVMLLGFCGGLDARQNPGDVVVATAIDDGSVVVDLPAAQEILDVLRGSGIAASGGILLCSKHIVRGRERAALAGRALAVDMESAALLAAVGPERLVVVRVVVDSPRQGLALASIFRGRRAWRVLRTVSAVAARATVAAMGPPGYEATDQPTSTSDNVDLAAHVSRVSLQAGAHLAGPTEEG